MNTLFLKLIDALRLRYRIVQDEITEDDIVSMLEETIQKKSGGKYLL